MGQGKSFPFHSAEEIWNEVRSVWKAGAGISYARLENGGMQWPCPDETHPGTTILHGETFAGSKTAPLQCIDFQRIRRSRDAGLSVPCSPPAARSINSTPAP